HGRSVERPAAEHDVERCAAEGTEQCRVGNATPELLERGLGTVGAAGRLAADKDGCVHGAGRGSGNALDLQARLLQQAIEHSPGEGAVRASALKREVHEERRAVAFRLWIHCGRSAFRPDRNAPGREVTAFLPRLSLCYSLTAKSSRRATDRI